ncbi:hypothetical protein [Fructobacillus ficulneus]|uniref:Uncharacterized protein n=1 Tax=Fructobacillus ficulneus TaxID=157463 RepID=A0A0K8MJH4_9LACO|nr:hypothetical protein [Fructobacillus ficulneus]GAP00334.1 hypothetical protein FFIC_283510 [Fructobacillus ficulneus]
MLNQTRRSPKLFFALAALPMNALMQSYNSGQHPLRVDLLLSLSMTFIALYCLPLQYQDIDQVTRRFNQIALAATALFVFSGNFLYQLLVDHEMATQNQVSVWPVFIPLILIPVALVYLINRHNQKNS